MVEFYKLLGGGQRDAGQDGSLRSKSQLAIVPGTTHYDIAGNAAIAQLVSRFFDWMRSPSVSVKPPGRDS